MCTPLQHAYPATSIFRIILYWNQAPFQDHLVLDNSPCPDLIPLVYDGFWTNGSGLSRRHACARERENRVARPEEPHAASTWPESAVVEVALASWRRKAAEILLAANAAVHLPVIVLVVLGYGPPIGRLVKAICSRRTS